MPAHQLNQSQLPKSRHCKDYKENKLSSDEHVTPQINAGQFPLQNQHPQKLKSKYDILVA